MARNAKRGNKKDIQTTAQRHGGALAVSGSNGNKGGTGAPPLAYRIWLRANLESARHRAEFQRVLEDGDHPAFMKATQHAAGYAEGLPTQKVEVSDGREPMTAEHAQRVIELASANLSALKAVGERLQAMRRIEDAELIQEPEGAA